MLKVFEVSVESDQDSSLAVIYEWTEKKIGSERIRRQTVHAAGIGETPQQAVLNAARQWAGVHNLHNQGATQPKED